VARSCPVVDALRRSVLRDPGPGRPAGHNKADSQLEDGNWRDWPSLDHAPTLKSPRLVGMWEEPMRVEQRLEELGLVLPGPPEVPPGFKFPFTTACPYGGDP
jgi:hypothetical protein